MDNDAVRQLRHCYPSAIINNFKDYPHVPAEYEGVTYYRSTATVILPDRSVVGDSHKYLVNIQLSREKAILDALSQLQSPQEGEFLLFASIKVCVIASINYTGQGYRFIDIVMHCLFIRS